LVFTPREQVGLDLGDKFLEVVEEAFAVDHRVAASGRTRDLVANEEMLVRLTKLW
jgi:hypothetical protein